MAEPRSDTFLISYEEDGKTLRKLLNNVYDDSYTGENTYLFRDSTTKTPAFRVNKHHVVTVENLTVQHDNSIPDKLPANYDGTK